MLRNVSQVGHVMRKRYLNLCAVILASTLSVLAQGTIDKHGVYHPTDEELAANKSLSELLRHPTFVTLRLISNSRDRSREKPSDAPSPYTVGDWIGFTVFISQSQVESMFVARIGPYYDYRPELLRDGETIPYSRQAQERLDRAEGEPPSGSMSATQVFSGREERLYNVAMEDWYEPLGVGHYQITVRKRFAYDGDWVQSNPVIFDVQPRKPAALIPETVTVRLAPSGVQPSLDGKHYRLERDVRVTAFVVNDSGQRLKVNVVDLCYGNRLQLFKDGVLIPYREDTTNLIHSKDENPQRVDTTSDLFVDQHTTSGLQELRLSDWYGPLAPGLYRLINRRRFEIEGPWTADSAPMEFEIVPAK